MIAFWLKLKALWMARRYAWSLLRLFFDRRVPGTLKALTAVGALVIVSPVDLLGDIPILGALDDTLLLVALGWIFVRLCPPAVVEEHGMAAPAGRLKNVTPGGRSCA